MQRTAIPLTAEEKKKKKRSDLINWLLVLAMLVGAAIIAYPTVSDWWNSFHATRAIASYSTVVESADREKLDAMIEDAKEYNRSLLRKDNPFLMTDEDLEQYNALLDLTGSGIMGYITIKSIDVYIPVYHGTEESVLQIAAGHVDWSSLPVGGESTHTVLSGHRGLPSAKLFTDLDQMKEGDTFTLTVLNQVISYEVDQIRIVEPEDVSELVVEPGKDYCTLVTCTPYGINTHRLLIRGHRVENEGGELVVAPEAFRIPNYLTIPAVGIPLLFLFLLGMLIYYRSRRPKVRKEDLYRMIAEVTEPNPEETPEADPGAGEPDNEKDTPETGEPNNEEEAPETVPEENKDTTAEDVAAEENETETRRDGL